MTDLYGVDLTDAAFSRFCGGNQGNNNDESCLLIAPIEDIEGGA